MGSKTGKKPRQDPAAKLARTGGADGAPIIPEEQIVRGGLAVRDVANHSDADQRDSISLNRTKTVRRLTRVEMLVKSGDINPDQALACSWYASAYELGFQTVGCTSNYCGAGGGGFGSADLLARYKAQGEAREDYFYARSALPQHLLGVFEAIVLGNGRPPHMMPKSDKLRFSLAAFLLHQQIGHMLLVAA